MFINSNAFTHIADARHPRRGPRWQVAVQLSLFGLWMERYRQRLVLAELDNQALADIGKSPEDVRLECSKWPWQA